MKNFFKKTRRVLIALLVFVFSVSLISPVLAANKGLYVNTTVMGPENVIYGQAATGNTGSLIKLNTGGAGGDVFMVDSSGKVYSASSYCNLAGTACISPSNGLPAAGAAGSTMYSNGTNWAVSQNIYNNNGNVGIGTNAPKIPLEVYGASVAAPVNSGTTPNSVFQVHTNSNVTLDIGSLTGAPYSIWMQTDDVTGYQWHYPLALNPLGGNVGIGTTNPTVRLDVNGGTGPAIRILGGGDLVINSQVSGANSSLYNDTGTLNVDTPFNATQLSTSGTVSAGSYAVLGTNVAAGYYQDSGNGAYRALNTSGDRGYYFQSYNGAATTMYVGLMGTYAGRVGINKTNPVVEMDVNGSISIANNNNLTWGGSYGPGIPTIASGVGDGIYFYPTGNTSGATVAMKGSGNVGIGNSSPGYKLDVSGTLRTTSNATLQDVYTDTLNSIGGAGELLEINYRATSPTAICATQGCGTYAAYFATNGNVGIGNTGPGYKLDVSGDIRAQGAWLRTTGNTGWYNETYAGGWNMQDSTWIRSYGGKRVYIDNLLRADGGITSGDTGGSPGGGNIQSTGWIYGGSYLQSPTVYVNNVRLVQGDQYIESFSPSNSYGGYMIARNDGFSWGWLYGDNGGFGLLSGASRWAIKAAGSYNNDNTDLIFYTGSEVERMRINSSGNVGIGTTAPGAKLHVEVPNGSLSPAVWVYSNTAGADAFAVYNPTGTAIHGTSDNSVSGPTGAAGVYGYNYSSGNAVYGYSRSGVGVYGYSSANSPNSIGVAASGNYANSYDFFGYGPRSYFAGKVGIGTANPTAKLHVVETTNNIATFQGSQSNAEFGPTGRTLYFTGGSTYIQSSASDLYLGAGASPAGIAIRYGAATDGLVVWGGGNVDISGTLTKGGGSFLIDNPLDPKNKNLQHSFVESPEMRNVYYGQAETVNGQAEITLPEWWTALNGKDKSEYNYQMTPMGKWCNMYVAKEIENNKFSVGTNDGNCKFSWTVSAIRHDAFAEQNRIPVVTDKKPEDKGKCIHSEACK